MLPLNQFMNQIAGYSNSDSFFNRQIASRLVMVCAVPLEAMAIAQNLLKLAFESCAMMIKYPVKVIHFCIHSQTLKEFERHLPGFLQITKTTLKIIGYVFGILSTVTIGLFSPKLNYRLHTSFDLIKDATIEKQRIQAELEAENRRREEKKAMEDYIQSRLELLRQKIAEKECAIGA